MASISYFVVSVPERAVTIFPIVEYLEYRVVDMAGHMAQP